MVCYDKVAKEAAVWSCSVCFAVFHLRCISQWAKRATGGTGWRCPGCQNTHERQPGKYYCFCGSISNPDFSPYYTPHSCGDPCKRKRNNASSCPHRCTLDCHPGPCPPCNVAVPPEPCFCGRSVFVRQCGEPILGQSCGEVCGKPLGCGQHTCASVCHSGACPTCPVEQILTCYCGTTTGPQPCGTEQLQDDVTQGYFACTQGRCQRTLACGHHTCGAACHKGPCHDCTLLPEAISHCPCGKTAIGKLQDRPRTSCTAPWPVCSSQCNKALPCGHACQSRCHTGPCAPCLQQREVVCQCGAETATLACSDIATGAGFQCKRTCRQLRNCGRHQCNKACCQQRYMDHECSLPCNKKLQCGIHQCPMPCHRGNCGRCLMASFDELACPCGRTILVTKPSNNYLFIYLFFF